MSRRSQAAPAVFREDGEYWTLAYEGSVVRVRAAKGLHYIAHLLERPGEHVHVATLAGAARAPGSGKPADIDAERVRKAVGNRIHETLERILEHHELLGRHLVNAIRTGLFCRYDPQHRIRWQVSTLRGARSRGAGPSTHP